MVAFGLLGKIERSTDGGKSWTAISSGTTNSLWSAAVGPNGIVIAVGSHGTIVRSTNAGSTWSAAASGTSSDFRSAVVGQDGTMVVVGDDGIVRSTDSGDTWSVVVRGGASTLRSAVVGPDDTIIAVGDQGAIARSTDAGASAVFRTHDGSAFTHRYQSPPTWLGRVFKIPTESLEAISRQVARKKRRHSGAYVEHFCGQAGVKASERRPSGF